MAYIPVMCVAEKCKSLADNRFPRLLLLIMLCTAKPVCATNYNVLVGSGGLNYLPATLTITVGDTVTFKNTAGLHNVVADDGSFRCANGCDNDGQGGQGNASSLSWHASVTFGNAGSFGYFCELHGNATSGMRGLIVVNKLTPVQLQSFDVE